MKLHAPKAILHHIPLTILVLSISSIYLYTLAPGLTWANDGSDGGDLITAAITGGIPHPTGYPLYLLVARIFQGIPVGSLAYRTNLLSAVATVMAVVLTYKLVSQTLIKSGYKQVWLAGLAAGYAFGLAPLIWSQAVITEVYALQALLTALILYLHTCPLHGANQEGLDRWRGLLLGLSAGNHVTTLFMLPMIFYAEKTDQHGNIYSLRSWFVVLGQNASSLRRQLVWLAIGLSIYLTLPLRALSNSPVNWGNPITVKQFWWLVSGQLYQSYYLRFTPGMFVERIHAWAYLLLQQFGVWGLAIGTIGLIFFFDRSRLYVFTAWMGVAYSVFAIVYQADDSYVYMIPVLLAFSIWIGLGLGSLGNMVSVQSRKIQLLFGLLLIAHFLYLGWGHIDQVDASHDLRAERFGRQVLSNVPKDALIFAKGDQAVFALWYFHFALHERPDLVVIAEDLLHFDWYQKLIQNTYTKLDLPGTLPWPATIANANPIRPVCYIEYKDQTKIDCAVGVEAP
jgi:hypothetical protein